MSDFKETLTLRTPQKRFIGDKRYLLKSHPRRGGIASVYRAFDTLEERYLALKVFRPVSGTDDVVEESFRRETRALSDLTHPNIVQILDSGFDDETGEHYIAMEWIPMDLATRCEQKPFSDWNDFFDSTGRQILDALAFAHTHATVHRDIKPSNVLVTDEGVIKVCDFGISKIRNFLEPGITLAQYASLPYAPPEIDDGTYSYSRDVFGFAALAVACLTKTPFSTHKELAGALEILPLEDAIRGLLRQCLSIEQPRERPHNAAQLQGLFDRLRPRPPIERKSTILIALTNKVRDIIKYDLGFGTESDIQKFIEADLNDAICEHDNKEPKPNPDGSAPLGRALRLYGGRYGYIAVTEVPDGQKMLLVSALDFSPSEMEKHRERGYEPEFGFSFNGVASHLSASNITALNDHLLQFGADQKVALLKQREQAIYRTWLNLLSAKTELERGRKRRYRYEELEPAGETVRFRITAGQAVCLTEDDDVRVETGTRDAFFGTVVSLVDDFLLVQSNQRNRLDAFALPAKGIIEVDTTKADASLNKQKLALDAVRYGRSVDTNLGNHIVYPGDISVPPPRDVEFIQSQIDEDKKDAVRTAMGRPALMIVQGPPGTGKTTFITELVLQTLREQPEARILLTSQTHVALDNSLERIIKETEGDVQAVRIAHESDERISPATKNLLVDNKLPVMRRDALASGKRFIEEWAARHHVDLDYTRMAMALERHAVRQERLEYIKGLISQLRPMLSEENRKTLEAEELADLDDQLSGYIKEQDALTQDLKESLAELRQYEQDKETIKHLAESSVSELRSWADSYATDSADGRQLRKLLSAHADWEARFGRSREFRAALIASSQVIAGTCLGVMGIPGKDEITYDLCIVDEASIATPTEVLVPMSRAHRTVLVGDQKQLSPFQDPELRTPEILERFQLKPEDQRATLFNRLSEYLPPQLQKTLTIQHRMIPPIGDLISSCFYRNELRSIERDQAAWHHGILPKPVTWYSTSRLPKKSSRPIGTSHANDIEVQCIVHILDKTNFVMNYGKSRGKQISVAILTGYSEQKKRLRAAVDTKLHKWSSFSKIYVNVVDAFQGQEADMLIFSVTRSDARGLGFLREMERINVALSRGKELLAIVGDHQFCQEAEGHSNPLKDALDYIRGNPQTCALEDAPE